MPGRCIASFQDTPYSRMDSSGRRRSARSRWTAQSVKLRRAPRTAQVSTCAWCSACVTHSRSSPSHAPIRPFFTTRHLSLQELQNRQRIDHLEQRPFLELVIPDALRRLVRNLSIHDAADSTSLSFAQFDKRIDVDYICRHLPRANISRKSAAGGYS